VTATEKSRLAEAAGIGDARRRTGGRLDEGPICLHCRKTVETVEGVYACGTCRKRPVSTIHFPGQVIVVDERCWESTP
jgi:hypothetical protein